MTIQMYLKLQSFSMGSETFFTPMHSNA